ncbi:N-acetylmuramoyl-L-alanine amidase [Caldisalinibacter kiritimatiensis]|uniref:N-acetylmuramoyl-L-alanine amidase n=1 Tax=Caldisalinibacter kiritimatiensis TaxID=1304284 RepID=R1CGG8_9FIRM|nr:N-acetylmuramoyl-L-alanine amidase [Caldisalinibacter kiritimatiensis]EOD01400.1 N-acetylmuramoyl-L-alanine amidase [Caldisalinibacter kiritimatiensis]
MKIIIDPGHGGKDPGGGSNNYWLEKDMTLKISLYQYEKLKKLGIDVDITRKTDKYLGKKERTSIIRQSGADICISNHINSYTSSKPEGAEVIHSIYSDKKLANLILDNLVEAGVKRRRVFSKSHPNNSKLDYYYMNRETGSVETVIVEYGFASNPKDTQRIKNNWEDYAESVIKAVCKYIGHPYDEDMLYTRIVGKSKTTLAQMQEWAKKRGGSDKFIEASEKYLKYGELTGIRADILYCQSAKETNFGRFTGVVKEEMNNFAGIKVKNPTGDKINDFEKFITVDDGVRAHFNHICAYVGLNPIGKVHPRYYILKSLTWAGKVKYVEELGGKWSPIADYGITIVKDYLKDLLSTKSTTIDYKSLYENCIEENKVLKERIENLIGKLNEINKISEV